MVAMATTLAFATPSKESRVSGDKRKKEEDGKKMEMDGKRDDMAQF